MDIPNEYARFLIDKETIREADIWGFTEAEAETESRPDPTSFPTFENETPLFI